MPSSVADLLASVGLERNGYVSWGEPVPVAQAGVYVVSLTGELDRVAGTHDKAPIDCGALDQLHVACPDLAIDGIASPGSSQLVARIASYWLADESVLYIGLAGRSLRTRVRQYYRTPLGAAKPHSGGWWLKTLSVLDDLYVHYAVTGSCKEAEEDMLRAFAKGISKRDLEALPNRDPVMPFANLRNGDWHRRNHGITGARSS